MRGLLAQPVKCQMCAVLGQPHFRPALNWKLAEGELGFDLRGILNVISKLSPLTPFY